jgi:hypothetical protein
LQRNSVVTGDPDNQPSGTIDYPEGYRLRWNRDGIELTVTEYHATKLRLDWGTILGLARGAGAKLTNDGD